MLNKPNPFIFGRPVQPREFLGRESELRTLFNRLRSGQSTAIVGEFRIGKSSLLLKLADKATQQDYLGDDARGLRVSSLNLHNISTNYSPTTFWKRALRPLQGRSIPGPVIQCLEQATQTNYASDALEELCDCLYTQEQRLVLLLDEFEQLLLHPNFRKFSFFATLRALDTFPSFSFVTTSRLSLNKLNKHGNELPGSGGSPLFNTQIEVQLPPFDEETVSALLNQAGETLSPDDRCFIRRVAGRHPFLVQAMATALLETTGKSRYERAAEKFYKWTASHFDETWRILNDRARTIAVILSLLELGEHTAEQGLGSGEVEYMDAFGSELGQLAELGLVEQVDEGKLLGRQPLPLQRGEQWAVGTLAFARWVYKTVIAETQATASYNRWLADNRHRFMLSQGQWDNLMNAVRSIHASDVRDMGIGVDRVQLRDVLNDYFDKSELQNLCFDLDIDYDGLKGESKEDKTRELIAYLERRGRVSELVRACQRLRPHLSW